MSTVSKRAHSISHDALDQAAQSGVERAIAARKAAGVELSNSDLEQVAGGALATFLTCGGIGPDVLLAAINPTSNAVSPAAQPGVAAGQVGVPAAQNIAMVG